MDMELTGRRVLVTGASQGIGEGLAKAFAAEGCHLALVARSADKLEALAAGLRAAHGVRVDVLALDMTQAGAVEEIMAFAGDADVLVNNAGAIPGGNLQEITEDRWRQAWDLKVFGYINMCRRFYAEMQARGRGVIINILGVAGEKMDRTYIAGSTGNAALMAFTKALGGSAGDDKLRVIGINPGAIATERLVTMMKKRAEDRFGDAAKWPELMKPLPMGRAGDPNEIGWMVAFLASDKSAYTTGTIITIDGGAANRGPMF